MTPNDITYRYMTEGDLEEIKDIEIKSNPFPWTHMNFIDCLKAGHYCLVQEVKESFSGFAIQSIALNETHLLNIGIEDSYRRKGLGSHLLDQILYSSKEMGSKKIFLEVRASNRAAIGLYKKLGFQKEFLRKNYYRLRIGREDAIVMSKKLVRNCK